VSHRVVASADEFGTMSKSYAQKSKELHDLSNYLNGQVKGAMWEGNAATKFKNEWSMHHKNMQQLKELLDDLSKELKARGNLTATLDKR
jgi:WXG100 family type VII secretion target